METVLYKKMLPLHQERLENFELKLEAGVVTTSDCEADSEYKRDERNDSDSDNAVRAYQYNLQDDLSPAILWIKKYKTV